MSKRCLARSRSECRNMAATVHDLDMEDTQGVEDIIACVE